MKKVFTISLFFILMLIIPKESKGQFVLNGAASQSSDSCFQLTPQQLNQVGSIWFEEKINLNESFDVLMELFFGCQDNNGADGIVFGFQPVSTSIGQAGGGIGFDGVSPSLGVEFDTWQNGSLGDPSYDHVAFIKNGNLNHNTNNGSLAGPIQASANGSNIEDCEFHEMRVTWNALTQTLSLFFDCEERLSYTGDIVNNIFGGDPEVFWGFTAATGGASNLHQVCFKYTTFLDGFEDVVICPGGKYQLSISGGNNYLWSPPTGLSSTTISNPIAAPEETTSYEVTVFDGCNNPFRDSITVFVDGDTVFFDLGRDTMLCELETLTLDATTPNNSTYLWSDGWTEAIREVTYPGLYSVTVTVDEYCVTQEEVNIGYITTPYIYLPDDTTICANQEIRLGINIGEETSYTWSNGASSPQIFVNEAGTYSVNISNECGEVSAETTIDISGCQSLYVPSAFSPNDDGINDFFTFYSDNDIKEVYDFKIFDRWGNLVYEGNNKLSEVDNLRWDGTFRGKDLQDGVYAWYLSLIFKNDVEEVFHGDVTLIR